MIKGRTALFYAALIVVPAWATNALANDIQACTSIKQSKDRLACFDRVAAAQKPDASGLPAAVGTGALLAAVESAKALVAERFKDPSSVQFRNIVAYGNATPPSIAMLCGQVNGKNAYGGYVGFRRFVSNGGASVEIEDAENSRSMNRLWPSTCTGTEIYTQ